MDIIFYHPTFDTAYWIKALSAALPGARVLVNLRRNKAETVGAIVGHPPDQLAESGRVKGRVGV